MNNLKPDEIRNLFQPSGLSDTENQDQSKATFNTAKALFFLEENSGSFRLKKEFDNNEVKSQDSKIF